MYASARLRVANVEGQLQQPKPLCLSLCGIRKTVVVPAAVGLKAGSA